MSGAILEEQIGLYKWSHHLIKVIFTSNNKPIFDKLHSEFKFQHASQCGNIESRERDNLKQGRAGRDRKGMYGMRVTLPSCASIPL